MMWTNSLSGWFADTSADLLSEIFIYLIAAVLFFGIITYLMGWANRFTNQAPILMTSLGILGTFAGIFVGLLAFDPSQIDASVPPLLAGMKTAFLTSVLGLTSSLLFGLFTSIIPSRQPGTETTEASPEHILQTLKLQTEYSKELLDAIAGSHEGSMVGEIKLLRTAVQDFRHAQEAESRAFSGALWTKLDNFAEMMSKSATEQVIEALKGVIVEFNQRLTEQFGDNFKRLDEAVRKLVDWQENYGQQLNEMTELYRQGITAIDRTSLAVDAIGVNTARIPVDMEKLGSVLETNQNQISRLAEHLEAFVQMRDKAIAAVPQIQTEVEGIGRQLKEGAESMKIVMLEGATDFKDSVTQTNRGIADMATSVASGADKISTEVEATASKLATTSARIENEISAAVTQSMENVRRSTDAGMKASQQAIESTTEHLKKSTDSILKDNADALQTQLSNAQKSMRKLLEGSFSDMGSALSDVVSHIRTKFYGDSRG